MQYGIYRFYVLEDPGDDADSDAGTGGSGSDGEEKPKLDRLDHPVNLVAWSEAVDFCEWVGGELPSEIEWEFLARNAGQDITYPWGEDEPTCDFAVMKAEECGCDTGHTFPVCSKPEGSAYIEYSDAELCDIAGNVSEWVQDYWHDSYNGAPSAGPWSVPSGDDIMQTLRVNRGGNFRSGGGSLRTANRSFLMGNAVATKIGFRCVKDP